MGKVSHRTGRKLSIGTPKPPSRGCYSAEQFGCNVPKPAVTVILHNGQALRTDFVEAYKWNCLAAAQGYTKAVSNRDNLEGSLTPEQITEGRRRARR